MTEPLTAEQRQLRRAGKVYAREPMRRCKICFGIIPSGEARRLQKRVADAGLPDTVLPRCDHCLAVVIRRKREIQT